MNKLTDGVFVQKRSINKVISKYIVIVYTILLPYNVNAGGCDKLLKNASKKVEDILSIEENNTEKKEIFILNNIKVELTKKQYLFLEQAIPIALNIEEKYNIPFEITLGQASLESGYGQRHYYNNYFGIKHKTKKGYKFKKYHSMEESFEDYAKLIRYNKRYQQAFLKACEGDKRKTKILLFLKEIHKAGYCETGNYYVMVKAVMKDLGLI